MIEESPVRMHAILIHWDGTIEDAQVIADFLKAHPADLDLGEATVMEATLLASKELHLAIYNENDDHLVVVLDPGDAATLLLDAPEGKPVAFMYGTRGPETIVIAEGKRSLVIGG